MKPDRRENVEFIVTNYKVDSHINYHYLSEYVFFGRLRYLFLRFLMLNYNYLSEYVFFWTSKIFISKVFNAAFEQVFVCWNRYSTKTILILILKYFAQQTNTYSKSSTESQKQEVKSVKS